LTLKKTSLGCHSLIVSHFRGVFLPSFLVPRASYTNYTHLPILFHCCVPKIEAMSSAELRTALDSMNVPTSEVRVVQCAEGPDRTRKGPPLTREKLVEAMVQAVSRETTKIFQDQCSMRQPTSLSMWLLYFNCLCYFCSCSGLFFARHTKTKVCPLIGYYCRDGLRLSTSSRTVIISDAAQLD